MTNTLASYVEVAYKLKELFTIINLTAIMYSLGITS
jgi:hypothetical protein